MSNPSPRPTQPDDFRRPARAAFVSLGLTAALAGCAGNQVNAQWSDPQFAGQPPRGAKVLVACYAADPTLRRVCADRFAAEVAAQGALPVLAADAGDVPPPADEAVLNEARAAGAAALLRTTISADTQTVAPGPSIGIGIGGFGGGYRSGGGVGFGMSAPIGGAGQVATGFAASSSLVDAASGKLMWSGRASAAPSSDIGAQLAALAKLLVDAARQSGQFAR